MRCASVMSAPPPGFARSASAQRRAVRAAGRRNVGGGTGFAVAARAALGRRRTRRTSLLCPSDSAPLLPLLPLLSSQAALPLPVRCDGRQLLAPAACGRPGGGDSGGRPRGRRGLACASPSSVKLPPLLLLPLLLLPLLLLPLLLLPLLLPPAPTARREAAEAGADSGASSVPDSGSARTGRARGAASPRRRPRRLVRLRAAGLRGALGEAEAAASAS